MNIIIYNRWGVSTTILGNVYGLIKYIGNKGTSPQTQFNATRNGLWVASHWVYQFGVEKGFFRGIKGVVAINNFYALVLY